MSVEVKRIEPKAVIEHGLKDGGHVILRCSKCNKPLADIWRTRPSEVDPRTNKLFEWKFVAECCYCGDKSYITTILGGLHVGGYGVNTKDDNEAYEKTTVTDRIPMPGRADVTLLKTAKFNG
jgi:hypothetical protein